MDKTNNLTKYQSEEVVSYYKEQSELQPCEAYIFDNYITPGLDILDIGVGGGRTSTYLAKDAKRYIGADYSQAMVNVCKTRYPHLDFQYCDATDLSDFKDEELDIIVFSFNGIDVIPNDEAREKCISEAARVLRPNGLFIFSSHNAKVLAALPIIEGASFKQIIWRSLRSIVKSLQLTYRAIKSPAFKNGEGYILDPVHGGMDHYVSTPAAIAPQLNTAGFELVETVSGPVPHRKSKYSVNWWYYVGRKTS